MQFQNREEAGRPTRSPSLWSGLEGSWTCKSWGAPLAGEEWGITGVDGLRKKPTFSSLLWNLRWTAKGLLLLSSHQRNPDSRGRRTKDKEKTRYLALSTDKGKGGEGKRSSVRISRPHLNMGPCFVAMPEIQARQTLGNHMGSCKQQAHIQTVKQKFVFTGLNLHILYPFLYQVRKCERISSQLCLNLCDPMDCCLPGSSVHGIFQARILEWVTHFLLQGIFPIQG